MINFNGQIAYKWMHSIQLIQSKINSMENLNAQLKQVYFRYQSRFFLLHFVSVTWILFIDMFEMFGM